VRALLLQLYLFSSPAALPIPTRKRWPSSLRAALKRLFRESGYTPVIYLPRPLPKHRSSTPFRARFLIISKKGYFIYKYIQIQQTNHRILMQ
jgi:hypothetical protein